MIFPIKNTKNPDLQMLSPTPPKKKKTGSSSCQVQATSVAFEVSSGVDFLAYGDPG
jgi:hypothetical protein